MKEHPILYSTPMVQSIISDLKDMTRREIKPQPIIDNESGYVFWKNFQLDIHNWKEELISKCPFGCIGDILWVREIFANVKFKPSAKGNNRGIVIPDYTNTDRIIYKADELDLTKLMYPCFNWKPSIFMPKSACRIRLQITDIKVERLQDISEEDAKKEGISKFNHGYTGSPKGVLYKDYKYNTHTLSPKESFKSLWQSINGKESWLNNPFVWVISFKKI